MDVCGCSGLIDGNGGGVLVGKEGYRSVFGESGDAIVEAEECTGEDGWRHGMS